MNLYNHEVTPVDRHVLKQMAKQSPLPENFRLYCWGWVELKPPFNNFDTTGAEFRVAKSGPRKGQLCIKVPGTERTIRLTAQLVKKLWKDDKK